MNNVIFALGGGTIGEHRETYSGWSSPLSPGQEYYDVTTTPVDKLILEAAGKQSPKVLLILTASEDGKHDLTLFEQAFRGQYEGLGATIDTLRLITQKTPIDEIEKKIMTAEVIYVSGGNTWRMMKTWRRLGIDVLLRRAYEQGTIMSGLSAGSICWFRYGTSNSFYTGRPFRVTGLGWFSLTVCPHYDQERFRQVALKRMLKRSPQMVGLALDEHAAIEVVNDTYRIHTAKAGAVARKCYWKNGKYITEILTQEEQYRPLAALLRRDVDPNFSSGTA